MLHFYLRRGRLACALHRVTGIGRHPVLLKAQTRLQSMQRVPTIDSPADSSVSTRNYDIAAFADAYVAISHANLSCSWHVGMELRRFLLPEIPRELTRISQGRFEPEWEASFVNRDHITLEKLDSVGSFSSMEQLLDPSIDRARAEFLHWHMELTSLVPTFGWHYRLYTETKCTITGLEQRQDLNGRICVLVSYDSTRLRYRAEVDDQVICIRRVNLICADESYEQWRTEIDEDSKRRSVCYGDRVDADEDSLDAQRTTARCAQLPHSPCARLLERMSRNRRADSSAATGATVRRICACTRQLP